MSQNDTSTQFLRTKGNWHNPLDRITEIDTFDLYRKAGCIFQYSVIVKSDSSEFLYSVAPGIVTSIYQIDDTENSIAIKSGNYTMIYSGSFEVKIRIVDIINTGYKIGQMINKYKDKNEYEIEMDLFENKKSVKSLHTWFKEELRKPELYKSM